jgi:hypothetical protein
MKRFSALLVIGLLLVSAVAASATTTSISPSSQTHAHGVASQWGASWTGNSPFTVTWCYVSGVSCDAPYQTGNTSATNRHTFYPCVTTAFTQKLYVLDFLNNSSTKYSTATEYGGNPC